LTQAVTGYIGDIFNLEAQTMTRAEIRAELLRRNVTRETADRLIEIIDQCDHARFSPALKTFKDPAELLKKVKETLARL
jgi:Mn-dependent DtxR family transcriptional regulator